jgi:hypothetical protein
VWIAVFFLFLFGYGIGFLFRVRYLASYFGVSKILPLSVLEVFGVPLRLSRTWFLLGFSLVVTVFFLSPFLVSGMVSFGVSVGTIWSLRTVLFLMFLTECL